MKKLRFVYFFIVIFFCLSCSRSLLISRWNELPQSLLNKVDNAIWGVFDKGGVTRGTAFVVIHEKEKYLITSLHVIRGYKLDTPLDKQLKITRADIHGKLKEESGQKLDDIKVVYYDDILDVAVMKAGGIDELDALEISSWKDKRIRVFAIGLAQAKDYFGISITEGIVSNPDKEVVVESRAFKQTHIEHTAPLVGGQSGGPLVDMNGRVIGVESFARGDRGLNLFYSTPLSRVLDNMKKDGALNIKNEGIARINEIYVTPFGKEVAEIDKLPREIGMVNGNSEVRLSIRKGVYLVTMKTEEEKDLVKKVEIKSGETSAIEYSYGDSGLRISNFGNQKIVAICLLNPPMQSFVERFLEDNKTDDEEKADKLRKVMLSHDILGKDILSPGQTWVEWLVNWNYNMYVFTWDPTIGEFRMPNPRKVTVHKGRVTNLYLNN